MLNERKMDATGDIRRVGGHAVSERAGEESFLLPGTD
jgi:hypothetical protein